MRLSGEILNEYLLKPLGPTANTFTTAIGMPPNRITAILKNEKGITANTAIRLGTFFKNRREAYRGQFDSENEALRQKNIPWLTEWNMIAAPNVD